MFKQPMSQRNHKEMRKYLKQMKTKAQHSRMYKDTARALRGGTLMAMNASSEEEERSLTNSWLCTLSNRRISH